MDQIDRTRLELLRDEALVGNQVFDLFALGYDHVGATIGMPGDQPAPDWAAAVDAAQASQLASQVVLADGRVPDAVRDFLDVPADLDGLLERSFLLRLYAFLLQVDHAAHDLNYFFSAPRTRGDRWYHTREDLRAHGGRLNAATSGRVVIMPPRHLAHESGSWWRLAMAAAEWEEIQQRGAHLHRAFQNLCRVPPFPNEGGVVHVILPAALDTPLGAPDVLRIAAAPILESISVVGASARCQPGPLVLGPAGGSRQLFTIEIDAVADPDGTCEELADRAERVVRWASDVRAQIVLLPEMVVPDPVVIRLKAAIRELWRAGKWTPQLLLAGTFTRQNPARPGKPFNEAIVLGTGGHRLWRQRKLHPYEMQPHELRTFGLDGILGPKAREDIETFPREFVIVDAPAMGARICVAICEDAGHADPALDAIRAMRPNLVFIPVMAGPLEPGKSEFVSRVGQLAAEPGATAIVVNSACLSNACWSRAHPPQPGQPPLIAIGIGTLMTKVSHERHFVLSTPAAVLPGNTRVFLFECPGSAPSAKPLAPLGAP